MKMIRSFAFLAVVTLAGAGAALAQATATPPVPSRIPHPTAGKADCLSCHGPAGRENVSRVPANHSAYPLPRCTMCHHLAVKMPTNSKHAMDAPHARCAMCHVTGSPTGAGPKPASHADWHPTTCTLCHVQAPQAPPS